MACLTPEFREHAHGAFDGSFAANCMHYLNEPIVAWVLFRKVDEINHYDFMHNTQQPICKAQWDGSMRTDGVNAGKLEIYGLSGEERTRKLVEYAKSISLPGI